MHPGGARPFRDFFASSDPTFAGQASPPDEVHPYGVGFLLQKGGGWSIVKPETENVRVMRDYLPPVRQRTRAAGPGRSLPAGDAPGGYGTPGGYR